MTLRVSRTVVGPRITDDALYLRRAADDEFDKRIRARRWAALIGPSRQGKTSALERARRQLEREGAGVAYLSFTELVPRANTDWWERIVRTIRRCVPEAATAALGDPPSAEDDVREWLIGLLRALAAAGSNRSITLLLDEFGELANLPSSYVTEILAALDVIRQEEDDQRRLQILIAGLIDPRDLGERGGSFGVEQIHFGEFSWEELMPLRELLEARLGHGDAWIRAILHWTGGHPFFTQWCCEELLSGHTDVDEKSPPAVVEAIVRRGILGDDGGVGHTQLTAIGAGFQRLVTRVRDRMELLDIYRSLLEGKDTLLDWEEPAHRWLRVLGFVRFDRFGGGERMRVRNRLIATYYDHVWVRKEYAALDRPYAQEVANWRFEQSKASFKLLTLVAISRRVEWFEAHRPDLARREEQYWFALRDEQDRRKALRRQLLIATILVFSAVIVVIMRDYFEEKTHAAAIDALAQGRRLGARQTFAEIADAGVSQGIESVIVAVGNCKRELESPLEGQTERFVYRREQIRAITSYLDEMDSALNKVRDRALSMSGALEVCGRDLSAERSVALRLDSARRELDRVQSNLHSAESQLATRTSERDSARRELAIQRNEVTSLLSEIRRLEAIIAFHSTEIARVGGLIREESRREIESLTQQRNRLLSEAVVRESELRQARGRCQADTPTPDAGTPPTSGDSTPVAPSTDESPRDL